ncbi:MAG: barstar family protein [Pseudonocardia sp.]|nr:barstar family protein [Pseudonocardia sp.]
MTRTPGVTRSRLGATATAAAARRRGASVGVVGPTGRRRELLAAIGRELRFPGYYGGNLDALEECLGDLSWLPAGQVVLVWDGDDELRRADPAGHAALLDVLTEAAEQSEAGPRPLHVLLTPH